MSTQDKMMRHNPRCKWCIQNLRPFFFLFISFLSFFFGFLFVWWVGWFSWGFIGQENNVTTVLDRRRQG